MPRSCCVPKSGLGAGERELQPIETCLDCEGHDETVENALRYLDVEKDQMVGTAGFERARPTRSVG